LKQKIKLNKEHNPFMIVLQKNPNFLDDLSEKLEIPPFKLLPILLRFRVKIIH
jgi:hypothetical protein